MALPSVDIKSGEQFPAYYAFNNDHHLPPEKKVENEVPWPEYNAIIYDIKAGSSNNDAIHANLFAQLNNGSVSFLVNERIMRDKLMATKKGQNMTMYDRKVFLLPYEMTSRLMDELNNLRVKTAGVNNQFVIERISSAIQKDRVSSLEYTLYRVKYYEDKAFQKKIRHNLSNYNFFTGKKRK